MRGLRGVFILGFMFLTMGCGVDFDRPEEAIQFEIIEVPTAPAVQSRIRKLTELRNNTSPLEGVNIDEMINLGKMIWKFIEENQAIVNINYDFANVFPKGVEDVWELEGFSPMQFKSFRLIGKNGFDQTVIDIEYSLVHRYGGSYQGVGHYLDTVSIVDSYISVAWGYTFNMSVEVISVANVGTKDNPIASLVMRNHMQTITKAKETRKTSICEFRGDSPDAIQLSGN